MPPIVVLLSLLLFSLSMVSDKGVLLPLPLLVVVLFLGPKESCLIAGDLIRIKEYILLRWKNLGMNTKFKVFAFKM